MKNYKQVVDYISSQPEDVQSIFMGGKKGDDKDNYLISLIQDYPWVVVIPYFFSRVEYIKHKTIYVGLLKIHRLDPELS